MGLNESKWVQISPNWTKWVLIGPMRSKCDQVGLNMSWVKTGQNRSKQVQNGAKLLKIVWNGKVGPKWPNMAQNEPTLPKVV